jgi:hypothetical protein
VATNAPVANTAAIAVTTAHTSTHGS